MAFMESRMCEVQCPHHMLVPVARGFGVIFCSSRVETQNRRDVRGSRESCVDVGIFDVVSDAS